MPLSHKHLIRFRGFTLVELMIAIVISSIIMLGVVSLYSTSRKGHKTNEAIARIQENMRFAANMITRDIRMAGYAGCKSGSVSNVLKDTSSLPTNFDNPVTGFEGGVSTFPAEFPATGTSAGDRVANTDAIGIVRVASKGCKITGHNSNSATIDMDALSCGLEKGDIVAISDCKHTAIFAITGPNNLPNNNHINHNTGAALNGIQNCSKKLGKITNPGTNCAGTIDAYTYNEDARVHSYVMHAYFIGVSASGKTKSLYVVDLDKGVTSATELVEGIEDFQITYGIDPDITDNNPFPVRFVKANDITAADMKKIVAVKFGMLLASINDTKQNIPATAKIYNLADTNITPTADKKLRFVYNTTVKIRNKGIR